VQRILSLATLGVLGGLVWMFLSGGGLNQLAAPPDSPGGPSPNEWNVGDAWPPATSPTSSATAPPASGAPTAPPLATGPTIKIASFNIQVFGEQKATDPRVMETLAYIVRLFDVVAIQEIRTQDQYFIPTFLQLVNKKNAAYDFVLGPRLGNTQSKEQYAFLFNTRTIACDRNSEYTVGDPDNLLHREPHVATFATRANPDEAFTFTLINVHVDPDAVAAELQALAEVYRVVRRAGGNEDDVIMLGDFNASDSRLGRLGEIPGITPLIGGQGVYSNARQNALYDNIIIHHPSTTEYVGRSGVLILTQPPFGLALADAEQVSDHYPVYAEFSVYERDHAGRIASRRSAAR
jgi:endonuclease/exonuclease/phosphatase family metal-dependent hydrolase